MVVSCYDCQHHHLLVQYSVAVLILNTQLKQERSGYQLTPYILHKLTLFTLTLIIQQGYYIGYKHTMLPFHVYCVYMPIYGYTPPVVSAYYPPFSSLSSPSPHDI